MYLWTQAGSACVRNQLDSTIKSIGFVPTHADARAYIYRYDSKFIIAMTHVNDIGFASASLPLMNDVR